MKEVNYTIDQLKKIKINEQPEIIASLMSDQWNDIHHSRNQDWLFWTIIGAITTGSIALVTSKYEHHNFLFILNTLFGLGIIICLWAAAITWSHWILHIKRLGYITWLCRFYFFEVDGKDIPISIPKFKKFDTFIVNGLIFSIYITLSIVFAIMLLFSTFNSVFELNISVCNKYLVCVPVISLPLVVRIILYIHRVTKKKMENLRHEYEEYLETIK
jgi:hypothetical protein